MGNTNSLENASNEVDYWWSSSAREDNDRTQRQKRIKEDLDEFKLELARKHEKRRQLIAEKQKEMQELRDEVERLRLENEELKHQTVSEDAKNENLELKKEIARIQSDLQNLNGEVVIFESERQDYKAHVVALKDVISVSKQMLMIREAQLNELREKVKEIEASLAGREFSALSQDLRKEYEKQLQNIRSLRIYYEERQRADKREKDNLMRVLDEVKKELQEERDKNSELSENISRLEDENSKKYDEIKNLESNIGLTKAECRQYQSELAVINQMFSQILLGFNNSQELDADKLIKALEENHGILQNIAINEESNQVSALPKVLLDLVNEVNDKDKSEDDAGKSDTKVLHQLNSASEIAENLPKVWKVLIELLSHQSVPSSVLEEVNQNPCYKVVETPKGPHLALSVSKTFIRLKDLILEKKSLERETLRLKHLNTHLECRLQEQEKRLGLVTHEVSETWHVVGKLQKKHQLLHTQEKILRYELAQKRKLLTELKQELEYSREKRLEAREKNSNTEKQWEQLRVEFASRKNGPGDDYNNSVESGYSDDKECSSEDEPGYETDVSECNQKGDEVADDGVQEEHVHSDLLLETDEKVSEDDGVQEAIVEEQVHCDLLLETVESTNERPEETENRSLEEILAAREERLSRLEGQCGSLVRQVTNTSTRSVAISNKLDALHEIYGEGRSGETSGREAEPESD